MALSPTRRTRVPISLVATPPSSGRIGVSRVTSDSLLGDEVEVEDGQDEVDEERKDERHDDGLIDGVADTLGTALAVQALVAGHHGGDEPEYPGLEERDGQIGQLAQLAEGGEEAAGRDVDGVGAEPESTGDPGNTHDG